MWDSLDVEAFVYIGDVFVCMDLAIDDYSIEYCAIFFVNSGLAMESVLSPLCFPSVSVRIDLYT